MSSSEDRVCGQYDVVVCGGGPAGLAAGIAAAREGARTLVIERLSALGGVGTGALIYHWMDTPGGPVFDELVERLGALDAACRYYDSRQHHQPGRVEYHRETFKAVALRMLREAGAEILFCTVAEAAHIEDDVVRGVFIANKAGRSLVEAKVVIDCTADGDIAASAGARFLKGDPDDGRLQHVNFKYEMDGVDWGRFEEGKPSAEESAEMVRQAHAEGLIHPPRGVFRPPAEHFPFHKAEDSWALAKWEIE